MSDWNSKKITTRTGATGTILELKGKFAGPGYNNCPAAGNE
jgi:hypothetical protein